MASIKNANENKKRILAIREILYRNTDEEHGITRKEIQSKLETQGFNPVQDETIISDIEILSDYGIDIDKLNYSHVEYVINCLGKNTTKVRNIKSYLLASLFNAGSTISSYYRAEVNHDMPQFVG